MKRKIEAYTHRNQIVDVPTDSAPGPYYVSVKDGARLGLLLGPFDTHKAALDMVEPVRLKAIELDGYAHFYSFGTCRMKPKFNQPGKLNQIFAI